MLFDCRNEKSTKNVRKHHTLISETPYSSRQRGGFVACTRARTESARSLLGGEWNPEYGLNGRED
jgi:hypothetical protein